MRSALVVAGAAAALAACGGGGEDEGYPDEAVDAFVAECRSQPQTTARRCRCVIERLQQTMPYDEFARADAALKDERDPETASLEKLEAAVRGCGAA